MPSRSPPPTGRSACARCRAPRRRCALVRSPPATGCAVLCSAYHGLDTQSQREQESIMTTLQNRPNTALLVIDVQNGVVAGSHARNAVVANVGSLVDKARQEQ